MRPLLANLFGRMVTKNVIDPSRGLGWGTFFCGFVPGLLQFLGGKKSQACLAFLSCSMLFFAGWVIVGERLFYWALFAADDTGGIANLLARYGSLTLPEMLNLPGSVIGGYLAFDDTATGLRMMRMPRDYEHIAGWLTAASGMLAAFWAAQAHWDLRLQRDAQPAKDGSLPRPVSSPALCAGLSWLVPGLGHARAGQKDKGIIMGIAVVVVFALGLFFSGGHAVDRANYSVWWIGQNLFGGGSLFASLVTAPLRSVERPIDLDLGIVLCTVAGLMNLVVMCDAYTVAERSVFPVKMLSATGAGTASVSGEGGGSRAASEEAGA
jgi:hypothetical protein